MYEENSTALKWLSLKIERMHYTRVLCGTMCETDLPLKRRAVPCMLVSFDRGSDPSVANAVLWVRIR